MLELVSPTLVGNCPFAGEEKAQWLRKTAELGSAQALAFLATLYNDGEDGVPQNKAEAAKWLQKLEESGDVEAMEQFAATSEGNDKIEWRRKAAERGSASAIAELAALFWKGDEEKGIRADKAEAEKWLKKLEESGNGEATRDFVWSAELEGRERIDWLLKAAERGSASAFSDLADVYEEGEEGVVESSAEEAEKWLFKLEKSRDGKAMMDRADMVDALNNREEALQWFIKAAENGSRAAMKELVIRYSLGNGVKKDEKEAERWRNQLESTPIRNAEDDCSGGLMARITDLVPAKALVERKKN
ncbi:MAG: sel1 repeat family protein [Thermoguttaceae bacterium]|nr:sel1 repeat family protein [Thermoguttaceae bacterium]